MKPDSFCSEILDICLIKLVVRTELQATLHGNGASSSQKSLHKTLGMDRISNWPDIDPENAGFPTEYPEIRPDIEFRIRPETNIRIAYQTIFGRILFLFYFRLDTEKKN